MASSDFWIFAYGSLMWAPGFPHREAVAARLYGFHRCMCILSTRYRGRPDKPGLVMGLDRGGSCRGIAFRVPGEAEAEVLSYLREREQVTNVYREHAAPVRLDDGRRVTALCFVARHDHPQYLGGLSLEQAARMVRQGVGQKGTSRDYLANTVRHLDEMGIGDRRLKRLLELVDAIDGSEAAA